MPRVSKAGGRCDREGVRVKGGGRQDVKQSRGDYTISFWVKPLGEGSLLPDGRFTPHISFASTISPPRHQISVGRYTSGLTGEVRSRSRCRTDLWAVENVEMRQVMLQGRGAVVRALPAAACCVAAACGCGCVWL